MAGAKGLPALILLALIVPRPHLQPRRWEVLRKHRKADLRKWYRDDVCWRTVDGDSQYDPHLTIDEQRNLEFLCIDEGEVYTDVGEVQKFYMNVGRIIGACSGELTQYIFAQWDGGKGGLIHGRPISVKRLRQMQVAIR